jgi:DUF4097 and DUF4098 domain-containing protein YvlB
MKSAIISLALIVFAGGSAAGVIAHSSDKKSDEKVERTVATDASVTVTLCVMAGQITVRGWNKNEVRARSSDAEQIELKRVDAESEESKAARKIDVFIDDKSDDKRARGDCQASADVELDVPKGATVQIQTRDGDISIVGVEAAYAGTQNGDISIEHVTQKIEVGSIGGAISVKDSSGRMTLSTASGGIEATNVSPTDVGDTFEVTSVSGDIQLERVSHAKLSAKSVTGNINLAGSLAHSGNYGFNTMSGDVSLSLPSDSSFRLIAKLSQDGEIITDFPLTITTETVSSAKSPKTPAAVAGAPPATPAPSHPAPEPAPAPSAAPKAAVTEETPTPDSVMVVKVKPMVKVTPMVNVTPSIVYIPYMLRRIIGVCGSGDASISVASFSGTLHLQKN